MILPYLIIYWVGLFVIAVVYAFFIKPLLNFLAEEGPKAKNPGSYIRFIYNRVNLEKAVIRASAVSALAAFAHSVPSLRKSIVILL